MGAMIQGIHMGLYVRYTDAENAIFFQLTDLSCSCMKHTTSKNSIWICKLKLIYALHIYTCLQEQMANSM